MKYKIETASGLTFFQHKSCVADIPETLRKGSIISIVERGGNVFTLGGTKQYWRKRRPVCIIDSRPSLMATRIGIV
jgi:hypothetical protein